MNSLDFLKVMEATRWCGTTYLAVYEKPANSDWQSSIFEYLPLNEISPEIFKQSLIEIDNSTLAYDILTLLLHQDLVYSGFANHLSFFRQVARGSHNG